MKAVEILQIVVAVLFALSIGMAVIASVHGLWPQAFHSALNALAAGIIWFFGNRLARRL